MVLSAARLVRAGGVRTVLCLLVACCPPGIYLLCDSSLCLPLLPLIFPGQPLLSHARGFSLPCPQLSLPLPSLPTRVISGPYLLTYLHWP